MFRVKLNGIEIECDTVGDVAAVVAAIGQRKGGGVITAPEARVPRKTAAAAGATTSTRRGRIPAIDDALARKLHSRYVRGESLVDLAAEHKAGSGGALYARFKALGLPTGAKAKAAANESAA